MIRISPCVILLDNVRISRLNCKNKKIVATVCVTQGIEGKTKTPKNVAGLHEEKHAQAMSLYIEQIVWVLARRYEEKISG